MRTSKSIWYQDSFFKYAVYTLLVLTIILLLYFISPILYPILWFVTAILLPILFSTFFYYLLRPAVNFLQRWMPRYLAIVLVFAVLAFLATLAFLVVGPKIIRELDSISNINPEKIESIKITTNTFLDKVKGYLYSADLSAFEGVIFDYLKKVNGVVYQLVLNTVSTLASIAIALALTPFVLFYFLKDDSHFSRFILRFTPEKIQGEVEKILTDIDSTLSGFIIAQMTVAVVVGSLLFCGYLIIGLPQALALAIFAMMFYVIPVLGTFIAVIPALIVAMTISFTMVIKVVIVMFVVHLFEANLISPRLIGRTLKIHPLTIILLLLAAGSLYGLLGLLLVTPTYAILKVIVWNIYKITRFKYAEAKEKKAVES